jgi:D-beta-D-heptose 7-phosphate kinase/D-beta-D-heptose 1-phosphate adenosyltransferase
VVLQDYNKGVLTREVVTAVRDAAGEAGVPIVVDPKRRGFFDYGGVTVFKPNKRELEDALGDFVHPDDPEWMESTRVRLGCAHLLVTLGDQGMALQTEEGRLVRLPAAAQAVFDVSGAGDTVSAAVAVALAAGADVTEAAILANHAAAVEVGRPGVQTVTPREIRAHVSAWPD